MKKRNKNNFMYRRYSVTKNERIFIIALSAYGILYGVYSIMCS